MNQIKDQDIHGHRIMTCLRYLNNQQNSLINSQQH